MTTNADARRAHILLDEVTNGRVLERGEIEHLRSFLPAPPMQKTLQKIIAHVDDAWAGAGGNDWGGNSYDSEVTLEDWLLELHAQLQGLTLAKPAHPEFLETEADYENAPEGTIVAKDDISTAWIKRFGAWTNTDGDRGVRCPNWKVGHRRVLRWGWGE